MFCNQCGEELKGDEKFCRKCGTKIGEAISDSGIASKTKMEETISDSGMAPKTKKPVLIVGTAIGIAAIVIILLFVIVSRIMGNGTGTEKKAEETKQEQTKQTKEDNKDDEFIFPHSDTEYLTDAEVEPLTEEELGYARNEIMARRGRIYNEGGEFEAYFSKKSWYKGTKDAKAFDANYENELNGIEKANVELIKKYERKLQTSRMAKEYYEAVLVEYQNAEAAGYPSMDQYPQVNPLLFDSRYNYKGNEPLYYTLVDLCGDGTPELFIGQKETDLDPNYTLLDMYGYSNGRARTFTICTDGSSEMVSEIIGERDRYYICDNLMIKNEGSGGAGYNVVYFYQMKENTAELYYVEGATQDMTSYFASSDGITEQPISKEEFDSINNKYSVKEDLDWYKLSEFGKEKVSKNENKTADPKECYEAIIQQYRDNKGLIQTGGDFYFTEKYPNLNWNVYDDNGLIPDGLSYALIDIDNNGIAELFIADVPAEAPEQYKVYDMYTYINGTPQRLFDERTMGDLAFYYVCDNGNILKVESQSDSTWYGNHFYRLKSGTANMEYVDGVWIYPSSSTGVMYFTGEELMDDNADGLSKEQYEELLDRNPLKENIAWKGI